MWGCAKHKRLDVAFDEHNSFKRTCMSKISEEESMPKGWKQKRCSETLDAEKLVSSAKRSDIEERRTTTTSVKPRKCHNVYSDAKFSPLGCQAYNSS